MNAKYIVIDVECTGLNAWKNGLIQLAWVVVDDKLEVISEETIDIKPPFGYQISDSALEVNKFTIERIEQGISYQEAVEKFIKSLKRYFSESKKPIFVGQFFPFDYKFLELLFTKTNNSELFNDLTSNKFIDTKSLVLSINLADELSGREITFPVTSLSKPDGLKDKFNLEFESHDALGDCKATLEVLKKLIEKLKWE